MHFRRHWVSAATNQFVQTRGDLFPSLGMVFVAGLRTDQVRELEAFTRQILFHDIRGLLLAVDLPAISDGGTIEKIARVNSGIVPTPELLFPLGGRFFARGDF
jgi:hypothetical protein